MTAPRKTTARRAPQDRKPKAAKPAGPQTITIEGREYQVITEDELLVGDILDIEDELARDAVRRGVPAVTDFDALSDTAKSFACVWLAVRREVPSTTFAEIRALPIRKFLQEAAGPTRPVAVEAAAEAG